MISTLRKYGSLYGGQNSSDFENKKVSAFSANVVVHDKDIVQKSGDDTTARFDDPTPDAQNAPSKRSIINLQNQLLRPI